MLIYRQPIATFAYLGGLKILFEDFSWSFLQCALYSQEFCCGQNQYIHIDRSHSSDRSGSRNVLSARMLGDVILMSDADHAFEPDLMARMLSVFQQYQPNGDRIDVLTGVYRYTVPPHLPVLYHFDVETGKHIHIAELDWSQELSQIPCAGAGVLMVRRCVFDRIRTELKEEPFTEIHPYSEDFSFFERLRRLGIKAYVAPGIKSDHLMVTRVTDEHYQREAVMTCPLPDGGLAAINGMKGQV